ncbi:MAG: MarR family transcriptional regulator [Deltaproteobacteria bacterium]|nr:MarR family transcriptional regulator [Candidatus Anaeroferrophillus wilburensis]MBN2889619.1 MarR family transcriptional regulator [Deltaproteobacteria bacterium]
MKHHLSVINSTSEEKILRLLRQIIRAIDQHSRKLRRIFNLTIPQIITLQQLCETDGCTTGKLAERACLSQATMTGIIDRLEKRGLVRRIRCDEDRRRVMVHLTEEGREVVAIMPKPLQDQFVSRLGSLPPEEQTVIAETLSSIVNMMEAADLDASPILAIGDLSQDEEDQSPLT